jgi:hypothetical protein
MGHEPTRSFIPFLDGQPTDQASTRNMPSMSQIDHQARDHEYFAEALAHSIMLFHEFSP